MNFTQIQNNLNEINVLLEKRQTDFDLPKSADRYQAETKAIEEQFNMFKYRHPTKNENVQTEKLDAGDYGEWKRDSILRASPSYSNMNSFYDSSLQKIDNMERQMIALEKQLQENHVRDEDLKYEEDRLNEMIEKIEEKQHEIEQFRNYQEKIQCTSTKQPSAIMSETSGDYSLDAKLESEERLSRIERMLVQVLNHQNRHENEISELTDRIEQATVPDLNSSFQLSETEPESEVVNKNARDVYKVGMEYVAASSGNADFILNFLNLLMKVDTDEKREKCLENVQNIIHDHFYEESSEKDFQDSPKDVRYPTITDVEAVDLEYLNDLQKNNLSFD